MKVRPLEKDIYNYIDDNTFVSPNRIAKEFGEGGKGFYSIIINNAVVSVGMTKEVVLAIVNLRNHGNIFEIAVGRTFFELSGGAALADPDRVEMPICKFDLDNNNDDNPTCWLPVIYCTDKGLKMLVKFLFIDYRNNKDPRFQQYLNDINTILKSGVNDRIILNVMISDYLQNKYADLWTPKLEEYKADIMKKLEALGES